MFNVLEAERYVTKNIEKKVNTTANNCQKYREEVKIYFLKQEVSLLFNLKHRIRLEELDFVSVLNIFPIQIGYCIKVNTWAGAHVHYETLKLLVITFKTNWKLNLTCLLTICAKQYCLPHEL